MLITLKYHLQRYYNVYTQAKKRFVLIIFKEYMYNFLYIYIVEIDLLRLDPKK
jgi:hypothetical protein